ncbi:hypothetical protein DMH12_37380 [Streptomyces sp. WAC 04229]|uniref:hypothetical protein n=1 Tax=Streptomyces sp. WAC 04229 TaxID=2203206 RepID=UPI000F749C26|nr:hypothetical protein [Streptomyces sp. WAC 04229]RSN38785.1 hypothetical protein DMH12_37380 [Streptomyces sp. WAC 04229]
MSGETAAIGIGFLTAGPIGAIVGGVTLPALVAASMWRARRREHDENTNNDPGSNGSDGSKSGRDRSGSGGGSGRGRGNGSGGGAGRHRTPNGSGADGRHKTPKGPGHGKGLGGGGTGLGGGGKNRKPKVKDPVADKLSKAGKGLADKFRNRDKNRGNKTNKDPKRGKDAAGTGTKDPKTPKGPKSPRTRKDHSGDYSDTRPWHGRGHKDKTGKTITDPKTKNRKTKNSKGSSGDDATSSTARDGLAPITPNGGNHTGDEIFDAEIVDDGLPPKPDRAPDDVIDGEVIDEDRIALVKARREKQRRRQAITAGKQAERDAARDGTMGDPIRVKVERIRYENQRIDYELGRQEQMLALAASTEQRRSTPVTYPIATTAPAGTTAAGVAVARQLEVRGTQAYRLLIAMAEQLANGLHGDADADMADHVVELAGIPNLCRNLALAVREAANALQKTAPLHPSVIKHLNNAAVAALTAARMADTIIVVFVQAHRDDIHRVMAPRIGEERWNIRNAAGTLDAAKLRAAITSAGQARLALPAGSSTNSTGKLVPASGESTKKLINLMKGFDRGHMVTCLSEVAGTAHGVDIVADSVNKLYRRMANTWPTESVVDDTVRATASKVKNVAAELRKAIKAAQRAHDRELRLNAKPRKGANAEKKWDVV